MATRLTPFWPRPATTSGSLWPGSGLCALCSGPLSGSSHTAAAPLHHKLKRLNSLFHRRLALLRIEWRVALCVGDVDSNGGEVVPVFLGLQQGLPSVKAQSNPVHEAGHPIASDHLAMLVLPDQGLIAIGIIPQLGDDLIVAAQDGADDPIGFLLGQELWGLVTPDTRQPLTWFDPIGPNSDSGEKAIEVGERHAPVGRLIGCEELIELVGAHRSRLGQRVHAASTFRPCSRSSPVGPT